MRLSALLCCGLTLLLGITGCGSGSNPIAVTLSPGTSQSIMAGQAVTVTAAVAHDSKNAGVTWSLTGPGALSAQTTTSVTYTAPSPVTAAGTATVTARSVTDSTKVAALTINLLPVSIALAPTSPQTLDQGQTLPLTATVSNDPSSKGVSWSLSGAGTLTGQTTSAATYNAPASVTSASAVSITATSISDNTKTAMFTVNLVPPPSVTTTSLAAGTVGVTYSASLATTNGVSPYTWSVSSGSLPGGLALSGSTISGTPTAYGTFSFTVQAKDAAGLTATANLSIKIAPAPLAVSTASLPNGIVNSAYTANVQSTGGATPITWSVTAGALPAGLALNAATGAITGTPTTAATANFTVQAADSSSPQLTASKALSITVIPVLSITTSALTNGVTSTSYSATLASTGGLSPVSWSVTVGSLPAGLSLNSSTGAITGTPTTAGTSAFTVQAADSGTPQQKVTKALSITIVPQLVITTTSLPTGAVTSNYSATLQSSGGTPAVSWAITVGALPGGLTLNASTGAITGTPTAAGSFQFTAQATDSGTPQQAVTKQLNITVNPVLAVTTTSPMASGTVNTAYSQPVQTNGGGIVPLTWSISAGALPGGLSLNASTGVISGTPTATGTFNFTVQAADSGTPQQIASKALSISIATAPLSVATTGLPNGVVGQSYTGAMLQSAGGTLPVTWSISAGSLPSWATLNASTGAITGTPNATGTTSFTVKATDSSVPTPQTATKPLSIVVNSTLTITTTSLPNGTTGSAYTGATLQATGGTTPYTWSVISGSFPSWANLNASTGAITGTPNATGTSTFTVQVADSSSPQQTTTQSLSITVTVSPLMVTTTSGNLPQGDLNTVYPTTNLSASGGIPPYTWSWVAQSGSQLPPGLSLSTSGQITGTPTSAGAFNVTVTVTDSATPTANTANANLSVTINVATCGSGSESLLNGQYAFVLRGFDNATPTPNPALVGGVLTFNGSNNNGLIPSGTIDMNLNSTGGAQTNAVTSGSYSIGSDHRGCMMVTTAAGTQNYRFSLGSITSGVASFGNLIDFDGTGPFTAGQMYKQDSTAFSTAQISGSYAFGVSSAQNVLMCTVVCGGKFGAVGVLTFSAGSLTGGVLDFNQNGQLDGVSPPTTWPVSPLSIASGGSYTISGATGRGTLTFTPSGSTAVHGIIYVVSASQVLVLGSDDQKANSAFAGQILRQSGTPFSTTPLSGTYVGYQSGLGSSAGTSRSSLLILTASGSSLTGTQLRNDGGSFSSKALSGLTYSVASSGRMTATGGSTPPIFYLVSANEAFSLNGDNGGGTDTVDTGFFQSQTGGPFSNSSANGAYAYGSTTPEESNAGINAGIATFTPATASISVVEDHNSSGSLSGNQTQSFTYSVDSTGLAEIPSGCTISATSTTCQTVIYIISPTKAVVMDAASSNPTPQIAQQ